MPISPVQALGYQKKRDGPSRFAVGPGLLLADKPAFGIQDGPCRLYPFVGKIPPNLMTSEKCKFQRGEKGVHPHLTEGSINGRQMVFVSLNDSGLK